jgi:hypothetical protein
MSSPFQNKFISKSPLRSHERKLKKLDKKISKANKYDSHTGDKDYDYLADLQRQRKDLVASHTDTNTKRTEEEDVQVREDEDAAKGSAIEMQSPLHGYVDASDMVDPNPPTAHMWNKVFASMADVGHALVEKRSDPEWRAKHQEKRAGRIEERVAKRTKKGKKGYEVDVTTDTSWGGLIPKINVERGDKATKRLDKAKELRERAEENKTLAEKNKIKKNQDKLLAAYKAGNLTLDQYNQLSGNTSNPNTKNTSTSSLTFNEDGFSNELEFQDGSKRKIKKCSTDHFNQDKEGFKALGCKE